MIKAQNTHSILMRAQSTLRLDIEEIGGDVSRIPQMPRPRSGTMTRCRSSSNASAEGAATNSIQFINLQSITTATIALNDQSLPSYMNHNYWYYCV